MQSLVSVLVYAAALDLYRRSNRREIRLDNKQLMATLSVADWEARPACLDSSVDSQAPTQRCPVFGSVR
jgi:hypothetical protein